MLSSFALWGGVAVIAIIGPTGAFTDESAMNWYLVRSVPHSEGITMDFVVIPKEKKRDLNFYRLIADSICEKRTQCMVFFWTNPDQVPNSPWFDGPAMKALTARYERHPNYDTPHLRLACWLYPSKNEGEKINCFYMPGADVPPDKEKPE